MPLPAGTRLGVHEIVSLIGSGGMGEVYRATDTRLGRAVAIKILPELFARDPDRLARFEREARTLAALNHPNIAHIHGLEQQDKLHGLVMELVEGEDLAQRLARGAVPLDEALPIARQIADALEAAHEAGIIHRDLKPANIKVKADGTVKVLDFGLAKAVAPDAGGPSSAMNSPTLTARATQMGLILGTAAYMPPEQARGKAVDRRADVWSFGVVLIELLTGERAFKGDDVSEVLAKVIERDPDLSRLPPAMPASLRKLLARCLAKDPKQRLRDIGEARIAIDEAQRELTQGPASTGAAAVLAPVPNASAPVWRRALPWAIAAALLAALVFVMTRDRPASAAARTVHRMQIALPQGVELYTAVGAAVSLAPDGSSLALVGVRNGVRQVFLRHFDSFEVVPVKGTESAVSCVFSLDGKELLVGTSDTSLRRIRLGDGLVEVVTPTTSEYYGGWLANGRVVFTRDGRLWMSGETPGAAPTQLTQPVAGSSAVESQPVPVPGTDALLFVSAKPEAPESARIDALSLGTKARTIVAERASGPVLTASGHLLFVRDGALLSAPFDRRSLRIVGDATPVLREVSVVRNRGVSAILTVSNNGTLVYAGTAAAESELVSVSRTGQEQLVLRVDRVAANPRLSPDGRQLMFEEIGGGLWLYDIERRTLSRLTDGSTLAAFPLFTRNGRSVVFRSPGGLFSQPVDGSAKPVQIDGTEASEFPSGFSIDGKELLYTKIAATTAGDIRVIPLAGGTPRTVLSTPAYEGGAQLSPDGKWLVYVSNELGGSEVFLQPYPEMDRRLQVSSSGGLHPVWNPKGGEIFYRSGTRMMSVRMTMMPAGPSLSPPATLFSGRYAFGGGLTIPNFAVANDGDHFIVVKEQSGAHLNVVLNWFDELGAVK
jgi:Tol biopolymer transport system component